MRNTDMKRKDYGGTKTYHITADTEEDAWDKFADYAIFNFVPPYYVLPLPTRR